MNIKVGGQSSCVNELLVNPIKGTASVHFKDGYKYNYTNVSRFAIANLLQDQAQSIGRWVNKNLKSKKVQYECVDFS
jgi:hypothetical protein